VVKNKVDKADWKQYVTFTKDISLSGEASMQLLPPPRSIKTTITTRQPQTTGRNLR
jgi:hypothetical protein